MKPKKLSRGRPPDGWKNVLAEPKPFVVLGNRIDDLRASFPEGDVWVLLSKEAYQQFLQARTRNWSPLSKTTFRRRGQTLHITRTRDGKMFYSTDTVPPDVEGILAKMKVGRGRGTEDSTLFLFRERDTGHVDAFLIRPQRPPMRIP